MLDLALFFSLACGLTWALDLPAALAFLDGRTPTGGALALAGLGAWGPTIAGVLLAARRGEVRSMFRPWRVHPGWLVAGLLLPAAVHQTANLLLLATSGPPEQWFYVPTGPEAIVAMVMFSLGEEFGWRGYAFCRLAEAVGPARGGLLLGAVWGLWHLLMMIDPDSGWPPPGLVAFYVVQLSLYSVIIAWFSVRSGGSLAVALAIHAGGHLENAFHVPRDAIALRAILLAVTAVGAAAAATDLRRGRG